MSDIEKATEFLSKMFKSSGMGRLPMSYGIPIQDNKEIYHNIEEIENDIKTAIEAAKQLAEQTLKKEKILLLELSDYLSDNRMLKKEDIRKIAEKKIAKSVDFIENGEFLFYRKHLKQQIQIAEITKPMIPHFDNTLSLNMDENR